MGIFETLDTKKISGPVRKDDPEGVYWQRIDNAGVATTQAGQEYVRISKTTIRAVDGDGEPGQETTQAFFRDKFSYLERELGDVVQAAFGLSDSERAALGGSDLQEMLTKGKLHGQVIEVSVKHLVKKGGNGTFPKVKWIRNVPVEELQAKLDEATIETYFPAGLE